MHVPLYFKDAAVSGLTSGFTAGIGGTGIIKDIAGGSQYAKAAAQAVSGYAINYASREIVGLQTHFSWDSLAAQVVGSLAGQAGPQGAGYGAGMQRGFIASAVTAKLNQQWDKGAQANYGQIALDAFGSAYANDLVESITSTDFISPAENKRQFAFLDAKAIDAKTNSASADLTKQMQNGLDASLNAASNKKLADVTRADNAAGEASLAELLAGKDSNVEKVVNSANEGAAETQAAMQAIDMVVATNKAARAKKSEELRAHYAGRMERHDLGRPSGRDFALERQQIAEYSAFRDGQRAAMRSDLGLSSGAASGGLGDFATWYGASLIDGSYQGVQFLGKAALNGATLGFMNDSFSPFSSPYDSLIGEGNAFGSPSTVAGALGRDSGEVGSYFMGAEGAVLGLAKGVKLLRGGDVVLNNHGAVQKFYNKTNDIDLIESSGVFFGRTEGSVYAMNRPNASNLLSGADPKERNPGMMIFEGQAAELFSKHKIEGAFSGLKRAAGQYKTKFGDMQFDTSTMDVREIDGLKTLVIRNAQIVPHSDLSIKTGRHWLNAYMSPAQKVMTRRAFDYSTTAITGSYIYNTVYSEK